MTFADFESRSKTLKSPRVRAQEITIRVLNSVDEVIDVIEKQEKSNFKLGLLLICIAIGTSIGGLELANFVMKGDEFTRPIFLAVLTGSCFTLNFIPNILSYTTDYVRQISKLTSSRLVSINNWEPEQNGVGEPQMQRDLDNSLNEVQELLSLKEVLSLGLQITVIYFLYNVSAISALKYTSASNQTILGSTTTLFTLFLGVILGIDKFSLTKLICVACSLCGVVLINLGGADLMSPHNSSSESRETLLGNCLALVGAFFYALYLLNMKLKCGSGARVTNERELFGWVGVFTICLGIPVLVLAHIFNIEKFSLPQSSTVFFMIVVNAIFSVISDYAAILAMLLTSPLVTSLALTSCIPITIFLDFVVLDIAKNSDSTVSKLLIYGFGVSCILVSVILINLNIGSESELIEEIIQETFDVAIQDDEILSPILSPYLSNASPNTAICRGGNERFALFSSVSFWSNKRKHASIIDTHVSTFSLDPDASKDLESTALLPKVSPEHSYISGDGTNSRTTGANISLSGGVNHKFSLEYSSHPR